MRCVIFKMSPGANHHQYRLFYDQIACCSHGRFKIAVTSATKIAPKIAAKIARVNWPENLT